MFDWNDLKVFLAVARHGSTVAAGRALQIDQSTVQRRLAELERRIGQPLVKRHTSGYRLTEFGQSLLGQAEQVGSAVLALEQQIESARREAVGVIRVTGPEPIVYRITQSSLIERFHARHPGLRVEFVMSDKYLDLTKGDADVALRSGDTDDDALVGRKIGDSIWAVYASRKYIERCGRPERVEALDQHDLIGFDEAMAKHRAAQWLQAGGAQGPHRGAQQQRARTAVFGQGGHWHCAAANGDRRRRARTGARARADSRTGAHLARADDARVEAYAARECVLRVHRRGDRCAAADPDGLKPWLGLAKLRASRPPKASRADMTLDLFAPEPPAPADDDAITLAHYAERAYLEYALSVVKGRALPDVCDGQKPVQRRILYAMQRMGLAFGAAPGGPKAVKSARVVGDVLGRYHPHGDTAAYDAMVRMAQDFALRYPLIDGQGNFGSRDGDGAAAMRYTEARLSPIARLLLDEIDEGTVDFIANYDGSTEEPTAVARAAALRAAQWRVGHCGRPGHRGAEPQPARGGGRGGGAAEEREALRRRAVCGAARPRLPGRRPDHQRRGRDPRGLPHAAAAASRCARAGASRTWRAGSGNSWCTSCRPAPARKGCSKRSRS